MTCGKRFTTYEVVEEVLPMVVKKRWSQRAFRYKRKYAPASRRPVKKPGLRKMMWSSLFREKQSKIQENFVIKSPSPLLEKKPR
jgi:transcriptional regulator NrdR family protein